MCASGGGVTASPAGAAEERGRAERLAVPELVTGDGEYEKPACDCLCTVQIPRNTGGGGGGGGRLSTQQHYACVGKDLGNGPHFTFYFLKETY